MFIYKIITLICLILLVLCFLPLFKRYFNNQKIANNNQAYHQLYAWLLLAFSLLHGILAAKSAAMISGKIAWFILFLIIIFAYLIKQSKSSWKKIHLVLSIILVILVIIHIIHAIMI
ncbi:MAG: hypothetical protein ACLRT4_09685 [Thomasclavelia sp.]